MAEMRSVNRFLNYLTGGQTMGQQFHFRCKNFRAEFSEKSYCRMKLTVIESKNDINRKNVVTIK